MAWLGIPHRDTTTRATIRPSITTTTMPRRRNKKGRGMTARRRRNDFRLLFRIGPMICRTPLFLKIILNTPQVLFRPSFPSTPTSRQCISQLRHQNRTHTPLTLWHTSWLDTLAAGYRWHLYIHGRSCYRAAVTIFLQYFLNTIILLFGHVLLFINRFTRNHHI